MLYYKYTMIIKTYIKTFHNIVCYMLINVVCLLAIATSNINNNKQEGKGLTAFATPNVKQQLDL